MAASARRHTGVVAGGLATVLVCLLGSQLPASAADPTPSPTPTPSSSTSSDGSTSRPSATTSTTSAPSTSAEHRKREREKAAKKAAAQAKAAAEDRAAASAKADAEAELAAVKAEQAAANAAALVEASVALADAQADLIAAHRALSSAQDQLEAAQQAVAAAQTDLDAAVLSEERALRDLADVEARIESRRDDLSRLARVAYQSNGSMGEWALLLSSSGANQLTERLAFLQSIGAAGNSVLADLAVDRADLIAAQARLGAARELAEARRQKADDALEAVSATELLARAAEKQVDAVVAARQAAVDAAREAAVEDKRRYQVLMVQSGALGARINDLAAELADGKRPPRGTGTFGLPGTGEVTSGYGPRFHPILRYMKVHTGTDLGAGDGIAYAADRGVVLFTEFNVAYGNMTVIDHGTIAGKRIATMYAHQAAVGVKPGDRVVKGQAIGVVGSTGYSTGRHLHFEVRIDGAPLDPTPFLDGAKAPAGAAAIGSTRP